MFNLLISLGIGLGIANAVRFFGFGWVAAIVPGVLALAITYVALNLRMQKRLSSIIEAAIAEAQARRFDRAIQLAKDALPLRRWLFGAEAAVSALIGQFHWWKGDQEAAVQYLERAPASQWPARIMLAIAYWRKHEFGKTSRILEQTLKGRASRKQGLLWCTYAWLLEKEERHAEAVGILGRAVAANPSDDKLKSALQAVQNGKKLKVGKMYLEWYNFGLETPPQITPPGFRPGRRATYR